MERQSIAFWMMATSVALILYGNYTLSDNSITFFSNETIYIKTAVYDELKLYYNESVTEEAYCLFGSTKYNMIVINNITKPHVNAANEYQINYDMDDCKDALGILHFHLGTAEEHCGPSSQDIYSYGFLSSDYPDMKIQMILCNQSYYVYKVDSFFSYDSLKLVELR